MPIDSTLLISLDTSVHVKPTYTSIIVDRGLETQRILAEEGDGLPQQPEGKRFNGIRCQGTSNPAPEKSGTIECLQGARHVECQKRL